MLNTAINGVSRIADGRRVKARKSVGLFQRAMRWALGCLAMAASAVTSRADSDPHARIISNEVMTSENKEIVVRTAFEVTAEPNHWYALYHHFWLDEHTSLHTADGKELQRIWTNVFTPANIPSPQWTDCRIAITFADLESAADLPRGKRFTLYEVSDVLDPTSNKWISTGWSAASPFFVTTDGAGKVIKIESFTVDPVRVETHAEKKKPTGMVCELTATHLKLKPGAGLYRQVGLRGETYTVVATEDAHVNLYESGRGFFFEPIDSPEKALELVELNFPQAVVIKTAAQYQAIVGALKQIPDWDPAAFLKVETPASYGVKVTEEPGAGYRVSLLVLGFSDYAEMGLRDVTHYEFTISRDGRIGEKSTQIIAAPAPPYGIPPGWQPEFGWRKAIGGPPINPEQKFPLETTAVKAYNAALRGALKLEGSETIAPLFKVTDRPAAGGATTNS